MTERVPYGVQVAVGILVVSLVVNSLFWSSLGAYDDAVAMKQEMRVAFFAGIAVVNLAGVTLGYIGSWVYKMGYKTMGTITFLIGLAVTSVTFSYTQGAISRTLFTNEVVAEVETKTAESNADAIPEAQARVDRANAALTPLIAAADTAKAEFEKESRSGFGPRATQRKSEWDAALAAMQAGQIELSEAEKALREARKEAKPVERSEAAIAADVKQDWQRWIQEWIFPGAIEGLPVMSGWLFGMVFMAGRREEDRMAVLVDQIGELRVQIAGAGLRQKRLSFRAESEEFDEPLPDAYRPKGNGEDTGTAKAVWESTADPEPDGDDTPEKKVSVSDERRKLMPPRKGDLKLVAGE